MTDHPLINPIDLMEMKFPVKPSYGPWKVRSDNHTLEHPNTYYVDLDRMNSSAEMLDLIMQIAGKNWADEKTIHGLVTALDDIFRPQETLCSWGKGKHINAKKHLIRRFRGDLD